MKTIEQTKAYCVINIETMVLVSKFYKREGDAKAWISKNVPKPWHNKYAVAEFVFDKYYVVE